MGPAARAAVDHMRPGLFRPEDRRRAACNDTAEAAIQEPVEPAAPAMPITDSWSDHCTPRDLLRQIHERLSQGLPATQVIEALSPRTRTEAETWIRRLPLWIEFTGQVPAQAVAIARIIGQRAMRCFNLKLSDDGRVVSSQLHRPPFETPRPSKKFKLSLHGEEIRVEYTPCYFPDGRTDLLYFVSPHEPPQPHCLSGTGHWSALTPHDAVVACGGPEAYAVLLAEAKLRGEAKEFEAVFEGKLPEAKPRRERKEAKSGKQPQSQPPQPVVGKHTAQVIHEQEADRAAEARQGTQRTLFEDLP